MHAILATYTWCNTSLPGSMKAMNNKNRDLTNASKNKDKMQL